MSAVTTRDLARYARDPVAFTDDLIRVNELGQPFRLTEYQRALDRAAFVFDAEGRLAWDTLARRAGQEEREDLRQRPPLGLVGVHAGGTRTSLFTLANDQEQSESRVFATAARLIRHNPALARQRGRQRSSAHRADERHGDPRAGQRVCGGGGLEPRPDLVGRTLGIHLRRQSTAVGRTDAGPDPAQQRAADHDLCGLGGRVRPAVGVVPGRRRARGASGGPGGADPPDVAGLPQPRGARCSVSGIISRASPGIRRRTTRPDARRCARAATSGCTRIAGRPGRPRSSRPRCGIPASTRPTGRCWAGARACASSSASTRRPSTTPRQSARVLGGRRPGAGRHRIWHPSPTHRSTWRPRSKRISGTWRGFDVARIRLDPYQLHRTITTLAAGPPIEEFPQTAANVARAGQVLFDLLTGKNWPSAPPRTCGSRRFRRWRSKARGYFGIAKEKATRKIDAIVALAIAGTAAIDEKPLGGDPGGAFRLRRHDARSVDPGGHRGIPVQYRKLLDHDRARRRADRRTRARYGLL